MPSRARKTKGRAPKTPSLSGKASNSRRSASLPGSETNSRCSTPTGSTSSNPTRSSSRLSSKVGVKKAIECAKKLKIPASFSDSDSEKDHADEFNVSSQSTDSSDESEEEFPADASEESGDEEETWSETSSVSRAAVKRSSSPAIPDFDTSVDPIQLPPSSTDLPISGKDLLTAVGVYEVLRHFHVLLRLSPFRFEDFCSSLICEENCSLISEIHVALLKSLLREGDSNQTWYGPPDTKDCVNIQFFFLDSMTWYECCRLYLDSDKDQEFRRALPALEKGSYFSTTLSEKLEILKVMTDLFISCNGVREDILKEGNIRYDDHCRNCHK